MPLVTMDGVITKFRPARKVKRLCNCLEKRLGEFELAVKMRPTGSRTKRPRGALLQLGTEMCTVIV